MSGLVSGLFQKFIDYLFQTGAISVPADFHQRCEKIQYMLDNDVTGIVSTLIDYAINSASSAKFKIESSDETLENLLEIWFEKININVDGVPTGLQELAKEYLKERWAGSSLCLMRVSNWEEITIGNTKIKVPTVLYFVNGSSVYIKRANKKMPKLGTDEYFLDEKQTEKAKIPAKKDESIFVQKPFARFFTEYPSPYLVKKGVLKNWLAMETLASKGDEAIAKVLPYLFQIIKGTENMYLQDKGDYSDPELKELLDKFKTAVERYKNEGAKLPANVIPFDQRYEHLIPDLLPILKEELYRQGSRALLAGLGFIDMLEIATSRQETRLNPKPFIAEVNAGVTDFKSMLMDIIRLIISENKLDHRKLFSDKNYLKIVNSPLKINVEQILDSIRSGFVYGAVTFETYQESLGIAPEQELERMRKEWESGLRDLFYPHCISNQEDKGIDTVIPITKKQIEKTKEKETKPTTMNKSEIEENLEIAPYKNVDELPKYIKKMTQKCQEVFMATFNSVYEETGDEGKAMAIAINNAKRCMKKQGYTYDKESKTWKKKE